MSMEPNNSANGDLSASVTDTENAVPLLLRPAYARCKSVVNDELRSFRVCLKLCLLDHSSLRSAALSFSAFFLFTFAVPLATSLSISSNNDPASVVTFNRLAQLPTSGLTAIAFVTLATFFRSHGGLRRLLFLDGGMRHDSSVVRRRYAAEIEKAFRRHLACVLLPSLSLELAHKIMLFSSVKVRVPPFLTTDAVHDHHLVDSVPCRAIVFVFMMASWIYRTAVFLLVCVLFRLTCELQILRFEGLYAMFRAERPTEHECAAAAAEVIFHEHGRIRKQLLETSHRYRAFIIGCLVTVTVSQLSALLLVFSVKSQRDFSNSGDLLVCSVVQLSGFFMCLLGAARITHRAQRIVSIASKWHMSMSCRSNWINKHANNPSEEDDGYASGYDNHVCLPGQHNSVPVGTVQSVGKEEDAASSIRQALVTYLNYNRGGITLFGFALDRGMLHTLFAFEMTLVLWILSKVVVF